MGTLLPQPPAAPPPLIEELTGLRPWDVCRRLAHLPHLLFLDSAVFFPSPLRGRGAGGEGGSLRTVAPSPQPSPPRGEGAKAQESALGRYSYITADPFAWIWPPSGLIDNMPVVLPPADPFDCLEDALSRFRAATVPGLPPFQGGAAGLFAYDLCHYLEDLPRPRYYDLPVPDMAIGLYDWVISFDHELRRSWLIASGFPVMDQRGRRRRALERRDQVRRLLDAPIPSFPRYEGDDKPQRIEAPSFHVAPLAVAQPSRLCMPHRIEAPSLLAAPFVRKGGATLPGVREYPQPRPHREMPALESGLLSMAATSDDNPGILSNFDRPAYLQMLRRAIDYIHAGDCFQVNIAQRLLTPAREPALALYERLRQRNPAPFAGYFDLGGAAIASASPERFLKVENGIVQSRPIKGTRPRGHTPEEDLAYASELLNSAKDRAENVMIVDLLRNDLGRVCAYGSVTVEALCRLESYPTVHHLVSEVRGRLRADCGPIDLLRAAFPGGSVTGAPKIRAMEIITELEQTARGAYCGSLGFIGFDGAMDTSLLIRTFTIGQGWIQFPVGGGIVADSDPEREYEETWHKAAGMIRALAENSR